MSDKTTSGIFKYLFDQNRPYSVTDIHMNLHKEYGKTAVQKSLDTLVEGLGFALEMVEVKASKAMPNTAKSWTFYMGQERKVQEKVYGKQKVYVVSQELYPKVEESEMRSMDARIAQLTSELTGEGLAVREAEGKLKALASSLTSTQAKQALLECEDEICEKTEKLSQLKKSSGNVTADDRRRVQDQHRKSLGEWRKRKRITNDIVDAIMEGYPKKKKDLYDEVGLETDQDVGVALPS